MHVLWHTRVLTRTQTASIHFSPKQAAAATSVAPAPDDSESNKSAGEEQSDEEPEKIASGSELIMANFQKLAAKQKHTEQELMAQKAEKDMVQKKLDEAQALLKKAKEEDEKREEQLLRAAEERATLRVIEEHLL